MSEKKEDSGCMTGKTPATIAFIKDAEAALIAPNDLKDGEKALLRQTIDLFKEGKASLENFMSISVWLRLVRGHHF